MPEVQHMFAEAEKTGANQHRVIPDNLHTINELRRGQMLGLASLLLDERSTEAPTEEMAPLLKLPKKSERSLGVFENFRTTKIKPLQMGGGQRIDSVRIPGMPRGRSPIIALDHVKALRIPMSTIPDRRPLVILPNFWTGEIIRDPTDKPNYRLIHQPIEQRHGVNESLHRWQLVGLDRESDRVPVAMVRNETLLNTKFVNEYHEALASVATAAGMEIPENLLPSYYSRTGEYNL